MPGPSVRCARLRKLYAELLLCARAVLPEKVLAPVGCWASSRKHNPRGPMVPVTGTRSLSTLRVLLDVGLRGKDLQGLGAARVRIGGVA